MRTAGNISSEIPSRCSSRAADAEIARLARDQHGVIARRQLVALRLGERAVEHRIATKRLHPVYSGVYAVGHSLLSRRGRWMAAVLAAGPDAVLSHRSAAAFWGVYDASPARVEVTVARRLRRPDLRARRIALAADEVTIRRGIPVTTAARTLFDLAGLLSAEHLEAAITEAEIRRLTSPTSLEALVARYPGRKGTPAIRALLRDAQIGRRVTKSELEIAFLGFVAANDLPSPRTNARIGVTGDPMVDAVWPEHRLIAELDSFGIHTTRRNFEADRARDRALIVAGWRVVRITWRQLTTDAHTIARELRILLRDTVPGQ